MKESTNFEEIMFPVKGLWYVDSRGTGADGSHWRFIGQFNETIRYDGFTRAEAEEFDHLLDTVCVRPDLLP